MSKEITKKYPLMVIKYFGILMYSFCKVCIEVFDEKYKLYENRVYKYLFPRL